MMKIGTKFAGRVNWREERAGVCTGWPDQAKSLKKFLSRPGHRRTEQYYMFYKATVFGDHQIAEQILSETNPKVMKKLGERVQSVVVGSIKMKLAQVVITETKFVGEEQ